MAEATYGRVSRGLRFYSFRELVCDYRGGEHGRMQVGLALEQWLRAHSLSESRRQKATLGLVWAFATSEPTPSATAPPTRPHVLTLCKPSAS